MYAKFNYESNGSFGGENGVGTKKLGRKRENEKGVPATWRATPSRGPSRGKVPRMFWVYATKVRGLGRACLLCEARDFSRGLGHGEGRGMAQS